LASIYTNDFGDNPGIGMVFGTHKVTKTNKDGKEINVFYDGYLVIYDVNSLDKNAIQK